MAKTLPGTNYLSERRKLHWSPPGFLLRHWAL